MRSRAKKPLIAVAMSGGVDSSVAAALLLEQGYPVIGVTMRLFQPAQHILDAQKVAKSLDISHYVFDLRQEFETQIIRYFCEEYNVGRTPNPCVFCNPQIKFGLLFEKAQASGAQFLATGHYVSVYYDETIHRYLLKAALNTDKDQSYFLYRLTQEQLARSMFPLAGKTKDAIRAKARMLNLEHIATKAESQENCFVAERGYQQFLEKYLDPDIKKPGPIIDMAGNVVGHHPGIHLYTLGQRKGLGIALGTPRYVVAIQPENNTIVIGENSDLFTRECAVHNLNFISIDQLTSPMNVQVKIRYRNPATPAVIIPGTNADEIKVRFHQPQRAVTPGQSAVFYDGDLVVGGGIIENLLLPWEVERGW